MPSTKKTILGVSYGHGDSSAALIVDGVLVAAAEEERFQRVKHYALFPRLAIKSCLAQAGLKASDIQTVAIARKPSNAALQRLRLSLSHPRYAWSQYVSRKQRTETSLKDLLRQEGLGNVQIERFEHHLAHLASAALLFENPNGALLSFDGLGDFVSTTIAQKLNNKIEIFNRVFFPNSLGFYYTAMTQFLGFPYVGDEFKVMGLSSYGEPKYLGEMRELVREKHPFGFRLNLQAFPIFEKARSFRIENGQPYQDPLYNASFLTGLLGISPRRPKDPITKVHHDLAKSVQVRFEEVSNHLLRSLERVAPYETLGLAGGCAHNSVWVGQIPSETRYKNIFVAPAAHDAGIAVGATALSHREPLTCGSKHWALLGPGSETISKKSRFKSEGDLIQFLAKELEDGKIIGLFQGRMEFGPRALGSRSILCDPRRAEMKEKLNSRVKHREAFRPFAASILFEEQSKWMENPFFAPTMEAVFKVKTSVQEKIPAVVHADQSCRIQSVTKDQQPFFYELIKEFYKRTGVPMLINTSFNDCEPIVCTKEDAIRCFENCDMDHLVLEGEVFSNSRSRTNETAKETAARL